jgi:hypothetical protein
VLEYYQGKKLYFQFGGTTYVDNVLQDTFVQDLTKSSVAKTLGTNLFYKYYDKEKNKILDVNLESIMILITENTIFNETALIPNFIESILIIRLGIIT